MTAISDDKTYEDRVVYLTDLIDRAGPPRPLDGFTFRRCVIRGPVIIFPIDGLTISGCALGAPSVDALFYELTEGPHVGLLGLTNTVFDECSFEDVGIAGGEQLRAMLGGGIQEGPGA